MTFSSLWVAKHTGSGKARLRLRLFSFFPFSALSFWATVQLVGRQSGRPNPSPGKAATSSLQGVTSVGCAQSIQATKKRSGGLKPKSCRLWIRVGTKFFPPPDLVVLARAWVTFGRGGNGMAGVPSGGVTTLGSSFTWAVSVRSRKRFECQAGGGWRC
jgi:hypothetical protein